MAGNWTQISSKNVLEYHRAANVPFITAVVASKMNMKIAITLLLDGFRQVTTTFIKTVDATFNFSKPVKRGMALNVQIIPV